MREKSHLSVYSLFVETEKKNFQKLDGAVGVLGFVHLLFFSLIFVEIPLFPSYTDVRGANASATNGYVTKKLTVTVAKMRKCAVTPRREDVRFKMNSPAQPAPAFR